MSGRGRIVVVEDEPDLASAVAEYLGGLGYDVVVAGAGWELDRHVNRRAADLVLLDLNLPGESGIDILRRLRGDGTAVIVMTANGDTIDRILGLELGADDYLVKPVDLRELAARVAGILRRRTGERRALVVFETVSVDIGASRLLREDGTTERLSPGEVALVRVFDQMAGRVLSREQLIEFAPGERDDALARAIDSRIARLRAKLATEAIRTVHGRGYVFEPPRPGSR